MTGDGHGERRRGNLYGRRKGPTLSARQAALVDTLLPQLKLSLQHGADPPLYFAAAVVEVWFEIGFGGGEHLLWQAQHHPRIGVIGAEPYEAGVAKLLSNLDAAARHRAKSETCSSLSSRALAGETQHESARDLLSRIRIYQGDARDVIDAMPDASLARVFILFPDPWPKKRHHKRRFIQMPALDALARVMKIDAELRFASDDTNLVEWTLQCFLAHPAFEWTAARAPDWQTRPDDWPPTRYEQKALLGTPLFLRFRRSAMSVAQPLHSGGSQRK